MRSPPSLCLCVSPQVFLLGYSCYSYLNAYLILTALTKQQYSDQTLESLNEVTTEK
jgi:hypothetical protein